MSEIRNEQIDLQQEAEPERTSGLMRVAGVSEEKERRILNEVKEVLFDKQEFYEAERAKTPEELEIISGALAHLPDFIKEYGGVPAPISPSHFHIIDSSKLPEGRRQNYKDFAGLYCPSQQSSFIFVPSTRGDKLLLANVSMHEAIHFNSFQSSDFDREIRKMSDRAAGLSIMVKEGEERVAYFNYIDEAVTEELTKRFDNKYFGAIPALAKEVEERGELRAKFACRAVAEDFLILKLGSENILAQRYANDEERNKFWNMVEEIQQKNANQFKTKEDVFGIFAEAYFTGKKLKVARLIEKTYGRGYFGKLGEKTKRKK